MNDQMNSLVSEAQIQGFVERNVVSFEPYDYDPLKGEFLKLEVPSPESWLNLRNPDITHPQTSHKILPKAP